MVTSKLFLNNITLVTPLTALLFGGEAAAYGAPRTYTAERMLPHGLSTVGLVQDGWIAATASNELAIHLQVRAHTHTQGRAGCVVCMCSV